MAALRGATVTATGTVIAAGVRVKAIHWLGGGTTLGSIELRDGGAGGTLVLDLNTDAKDGEHIVSLGPDYIQFETDVHATLAGVTSLTILYH